MPAVVIDKLDTAYQFRTEWNLINLPPEGHEDVGMFFWKLFLESYVERERLDMPERWLEGYRLFRGNLWERRLLRKKRHQNTVNLLVANINRTVANITSKTPVAEVITLDGIEDGADTALSNKVKRWYSETEQQKVLTSSVYNMETYGSTVEKGVYDRDTRNTEIISCDIFSIFPAPGNFDNLEKDCPYVTHAYPMDVDIVESKYGVEHISPDDTYSVLGEDREDHRPVPSGTRLGTQNYPGNYAPVAHPQDSATYRQRRTLVAEVWIRDYSTKKVTSVYEDPETGATIKEIAEVPLYPGNIRVVTVAGQGAAVLSDVANPNINPSLPIEIASETYLWNHFPFYKADSYEDTTLTWGFSMAEQTGDILKRINELISRIDAYCSLALLPPLILPIDSGVTKKHVNNKPGLQLYPITAAVAAGIRYLQVPDPPRVLFDMLNFYISVFDRICQIEDADRGQVPSGVIAASAIVALQERGAVMIRQKIRSVDFLVRQRGRITISHFQNFGVDPELVDVQGNAVQIHGVALAGRKFNYVVESGSTVAKTNLQVQEQAVELYKLNAVDRQALLEVLNFPGWKQIIERVGEGQLAQAIQILIQAGMPEEMAMELQRQLMEPQGGPGNRPQAGSGAQGPQPGQVGPASGPVEWQGESPPIVQ